MEMTMKEDGRWLVLKISGILDTPAAQGLMKDLEGVKALETNDVMVDCSELTYLSSSGLRMFLRLRKLTWANHHRLSIKGVSTSIMTVFKLAGMHSLFNM